MSDEITVVKTEEAPAEVAEVASEAVVAQAEASVEIAQTEADAAMQIAAVHAETDQAAIEAAAEVAKAVTREELETCLRNLETLSLQQQELTSLTRSISERLEKLEPPRSLPAELENSARTENPGEAEAPPEPVKKKSGVRWT